MSIKIISTNRQAGHEYHLLDKIEAGLVLSGTEVKSLRLGRVNLSDGWVDFSNNEAFLCDVQISPYSHGNYANHSEKRTRKLLLHKSEIQKLESKVAERGLTIVPTRIYFKDAYIKIELAVAKGKKQYDKREDQKKREVDKEISRTMKERNQKKY